MDPVASELLDGLTHVCEVKAAVYESSHPNDHSCLIEAVGHDGQVYRVEADLAMDAVLLLAEQLRADVSDM